MLRVYANSSNKNQSLQFVFHSTVFKKLYKFCVCVWQNLQNKKFLYFKVSVLCTHFLIICLWLFSACIKHLIGRHPPGDRHYHMFFLQSVVGLTGCSDHCHRMPCSFHFPALFALQEPLCQRYPAIIGVPQTAHLSFELASYLPIPLTTIEFQKKSSQLYNLSQA